MNRIIEENNRIRESVNRAYSNAARLPGDEHPFPVGQLFAESVGYPRELLSRLPAASKDAFSGVSNVSCFAEIPTGATVLDLGCGAGLDSLTAAMKVGKRGLVIGIDFSDAMLERARNAASECGIDRTAFVQAEAGKLPLSAGSIDMALVNGIFNLNPEREAIFGELGRVVRAGGTVYAAELILREPLPPEIRGKESNWFA